MPQRGSGLGGAPGALPTRQAGGGARLPPSGEPRHGHGGTGGGGSPVPSHLSSSHEAGDLLLAAGG